MGCSKGGQGVCAAHRVELRGRNGGCAAHRADFGDDGVSELLEVGWGAQRAAPRADLGVEGFVLLRGSNQGVGGVGVLLKVGVGGGVVLLSVELRGGNGVGVLLAGLIWGVGRGAVLL